MPKEEYHCNGCRCTEYTNLKDKLTDEYVAELLYKIDQDVEELREFQKMCGKLLKKIAK